MTEDNAEIFVMDADGSNPVNLTNKPGDDSNPAWSPDGKKIAFNSNTPQGGRGLFVMNADGTNVEQIQEVTRFTYPAWSPDGKKIAYARVDTVNRSHEIFLCDADGNNPRQLTNLRGLNTLAAWSPDGKSIAFQHHEGLQPRALYIMDADGGNPCQIVAGEAHIGRSAYGGGRPAWKPKVK